MRKRFLFLLVACFSTVALSAQTPGEHISKNAQVTSKTAQVREAAPNGQEIAAHFAAVKVYNEEATTARIKGKMITVIPASSEKDKPGLGEAIAVLDTQMKGDETNLPPGKYNLFLAKVGNRWHCYAESDGKIVAEAASVSVIDTGGPKKPVISRRGWSISIKCRNWHCKIVVKF